MLMVVFGAGASYDAVPSRPAAPPYSDLDARLPLANQLFDDRPLFSAVMQQFPRCQAIIPWVRNVPNVEQVLEHLQTESDAYAERHRQLAAVRYYLNSMLWQCQSHWNGIAKGVTNYKTLLDQIERWRKPEEQVCLVTFNYDLMIEQVLPAVGVQINDLPDYISNDHYKLIKLHGSVNWGRVIDTPIPRVRDLRDDMLANEIISKVQELDVTDKFRLMQSYPVVRSQKDGQHVAAFPAIAIPVQSKQTYECPKDHLKALSEFIPKTTKLLMIGWRAMETHFLKLFAEQLKSSINIMAVCGSEDDAKQSLLNLNNAGIDTSRAIASSKGFTDFVISREGDGFLSA